MRFFCCLLDPTGTPITEQAQAKFEALPKSFGLRCEWHTYGALSALLATHEAADSAFLACNDGCVGLGTVRLDNGADVERWVDSSQSGLTDLELAVRIAARYGTKYIPDLLGDFAFVVWDQRNMALIAARDALGVKRLFYSELNGLIAFASRAEALAIGRGYDVQYMAELAAFCLPAAERTAYQGVCALPPGTMGALQHGHLTVRRYWSAYDFEPEKGEATSEAAAAETCRDLLARSVASRLTGKADTWAQLSGGLDSSAVVSTAQWLAASNQAAAGLAGSVTWVDKSGMGGDEREFSDSVAAQFGLRNEKLFDTQLWDDPEVQPPRLDLPTGAFGSYPRWHRLRDVVRAAGGRVLLTGIGGDELFRGNMLFFADWLVSGRVHEAIREMARRAAIGRASFWELSFKNAIVPLLPVSCQHRLMGRVGQMPPFIAQEAARRYELRSRTRDAASYHGRVGRKYSDAMAKEVTMIPNALLAVSIIEDSLDVRHPFLYRPLVEFARRLPPELCVKPYARKWVLRKAMTGVLPNAVRERIGKASTSGLLASSLLRQRDSLAKLVADPILAQLGVIDGKKFRAAFSATQTARFGVDHLAEDVHYTLSIEAWLQLRSGRWPQETNLKKFA